MSKDQNLPLQNSKDNLPDNWFFKQSSELELLISVAIVFASFTVSGLVEDMIITLLNNNVPSNSEWLFLLAIISLFTSSILPITIVVHFLFRFYWLSLVGLRSVFNGKPEIKEFSEKFKRVLKKPLDLDRQIDLVDRISSSIFAFAFMTLFAFILSVTSVILIVYLLLPSIAQLFDSEISDSIISITGNAFLFLCFIYMIDFFTLGWFKRIKKKWFVKIYYPIYRFMSAITLSFFYRGIYYSLVQHTSKKFVAILLPVYVFSTIFLLNAGYSSSKIFDANIHSFSVIDASFKNQYYADRFIDQNVQIQTPFIESYDVPEGKNHIKLHIPILANIEDSLLARCSDIQPVNKRRSVNWRKFIQTGFNRQKLEGDTNFNDNAEKTIDCFRLFSRVILDDSIDLDPKYRFMEWLKPEKPVFVTVIGLDSLTSGEHTILFKYVVDGEDKASWQIPFWRD